MLKAQGAVLRARAAIAALLAITLESMGIKIDRLTPEQEEYLASWNEGT